MKCLYVNVCVRCFVPHFCVEKQPICYCLVQRCFSSSFLKTLFSISNLLICVLLARNIFKKCTHCTHMKNLVDGTASERAAHARM